VGAVRSSTFPLVPGRYERRGRHEAGDGLPAGWELVVQRGLRGRVVRVDCVPSWPGSVEAGCERHDRP
jgi:hypothetical protein